MGLQIPIQNEPSSGPSDLVKIGAIFFFIPPNVLVYNFLQLQEVTTEQMIIPSLKQNNYDKLYRIRLKFFMKFDWKTGWNKLLQKFIYFTNQLISCKAANHPATKFLIFSTIFFFISTLILKQHEKLWEGLGGGNAALRVFTRLFENIDWISLLNEICSLQSNWIQMHDENMNEKII